MLDRTFLFAQPPPQRPKGPKAPRPSQRPCLCFGQHEAAEPAVRLTGFSPPGLMCRPERAPGPHVPYVPFESLGESKPLAWKLKEDPSRGYATSPNLHFFLWDPEVKLPDGRARMLKASAPAVVRFGTAESDRPLHCPGSHLERSLMDGAESMFWAHLEIC